MMSANKRASKGQQDRRTAAADLAHQSGGKKTSPKTQKAPKARTVTPPSSAKEGPASTATATASGQARPSLAAKAAAFLLAEAARFPFDVAADVVAALIVVPIIVGLFYFHPFTPDPASPVPIEPTVWPTSLAPDTASPTLAPSPTETLRPTEAPYSPAPQPTYAREAIGAPAMPSQVTIQYLAKRCDPGIYQPEPCHWIRIVWGQPIQNWPSDVEMRIYALTECLHPPTIPTVPCFVGGVDEAPLEHLVLVRAVSAALLQGEFEMRQDSPPLLDSFLGVRGPHVYAYAIQAVNHNGGSKMVVVVSAAL